MFYYELVNIHHEKSGKCWHARRFGPLSAGSDSRLYCISVRPFAAARHGFEPGPGKGRHHVGGIEGEGGVAGGPVGRTRFGLGLSWEVVALAAASSPPALFDSSESNLNAAGRPGGSLRKAHEVFKARGLVPPPEPLVLCMHMSVKHTGFFE